MFKIWSKVVYNHHWYTNEEGEERLLYTTIDTIDIYIWKIDYYSKWLKLSIEWLRLASKEEIETYFII